MIKQKRLRFGSLVMSPQSISPKIQVSGEMRNDKIFEKRKNMGVYGLIWFK